MDHRAKTTIVDLRGGLVKLSIEGLIMGWMGLIMG